MTQSLQVMLRMTRVGFIMLRMTRVGFIMLRMTYSASCSAC